MQRLTISLPSDLTALLQREAHRRRVTVSEIARNAIYSHLRPAEKSRAGLAFAALGHSGKRNTARNVDTILKNEWTKKSGPGDR